MIRSDKSAQACAVLLAWCAGCGDTGGPLGESATDLRTIVCDGSSDLRVYVGGVTRPDRLSPDQRLLFENGFYVLLDGQCRFWASSVEDSWAEVRIGTLDRETALLFLAELRYARWDELEGVYPPAPGVFDVGDTVFMNAAHRVVCVGNCGADVVPADVMAMLDVVTPWNQRLWQAGTSVGGDVRMQVFESGYIGEGADIIRANGSTWPLTSLDLHAIAVAREDAESIGFGDGIRVTGAEADALRELRRQYMAGEHGNWWYGTIPIVDEDGVIFDVIIRDTTPFENDRGLLDWLHGDRY